MGKLRYALIDSRWGNVSQWVNYYKSFFSAKVFYRSMHRNKQTNKKLIIKHPFLNKTLAIIVSLVAWCYVLSLRCLKLRILKRKVDSNGSCFSWHFLTGSMMEFRALESKGQWFKFNLGSNYELHIF